MGPCFVFEQKNEKRPDEKQGEGYTMAFYIPPVNDDESERSESDTDLDEDKGESHVTGISLQHSSLFTAGVYLQILVVLSMAFFWLWVPTEHPV